jgi:hypothetical protein
MRSTMAHPIIDLESLYPLQPGLATYSESVGTPLVLVTNSMAGLKK